LIFAFFIIFLFLLGIIAIPGVARKHLAKNSNFCVFANFYANLFCTESQCSVFYNSQRLCNKVTTFYLPLLMPISFGMSKREFFACLHCLLKLRINVADCGKKNFYKLPYFESNGSVSKFRRIPSVMCNQYLLKTIHAVYNCRQPMNGAA
jgi:hypothetical protein